MKNLKINNKAMVALALAGSVALSSMAYCMSVEHEEEYCKLCDIVGLQHQANVINDGVNNFRYDAIYIPGNDEESNDYSFDENIVNVSHSFEKSKLEKRYAVDLYGVLQEYKPTGERVELYDTSAYGTNLVKVFKR